MQYIWHKFRITGLDKDTGKKSTITIITRATSPAKEKLMREGIMPPYQTKEIHFDEPTDAQRNYALDLGIKIIAGMNRQDVSALISRSEENDAPASESLKQFAYIKDIYFSPFVGENALRYLLSNELDAEGLRQFKKNFPEPADVDNGDDDTEIPQVTDADLYVDAGIYDESYSIDGQDGKIRLNFFAAIIKRGGKTADVIIPLSKIKDVHVGVSDSIFDLNYIRFVLDGDDTTYYKPSSFPPKGFQYAVRFSNQKYVQIAERIKQRVAELSPDKDKMTVTGFYTPNQKPSSNRYFSMGCTGAVVLLVLCLVINSCFDSTNDSDVQAPAPVPTSTQNQNQNQNIEESAQNNLPSKISVLPSIGATREEFNQKYTENARNSDSIIRYGKDTYIVEFNGDRTISITLQPLAENNHMAGVNLNDFLPTDTKIIADKTRADSMVKYGELECYSDLLKSVVPASKGNFGVYFNYDVKTGAFLGGTIRLLIK